MVRWAYLVHEGALACDLKAEHLPLCQGLQRLKHLHSANRIVIVLSDCNMLGEDVSLPEVGRREKGRGRG